MMSVMTGTDGLTDGREGVEVREKTPVRCGTIRGVNSTKSKKRKTSGRSADNVLHHFRDTKTTTGFVRNGIGAKFAGASEAVGAKMA